MFGHEKLDVYRLALTYVAFVYRSAESLSGNNRHARDQWLRASQSIVLNIAEGNGKSTPKDRRKFFDIARGSTLECAAVQDILEISGAMSKEENMDSKQMLNRIVAMLTRLIQLQNKSLSQS